MCVGLSVNGDFELVIIGPVDHGVKHWKLSILFAFNGEFDGRRDLIDMCSKVV